MQCRSGTFCTEIDTTSAHRGPYLGAATGELLVLVEGRGLSAYELTTGARRWHLDLAINPMHPVPRVATVDGEAAVAVASPAGEVVAVDTRQGRIRWREPAPGIEDVFAVRADGESWLATVRTRRDNTSMLDVVTLPPAGDPPAPGHGADEPDLDHVAAGLRTARCCEALVAAAARDGLDLRRADGVPGGLIQVLHADTGRHVADLSLATYHGQRLAQGRWLFVAPHRAVVVTTRPAA
ncbi:MAG: PQQ-binding-like beta-propeller repeat protein [Egicoccus sp.]